MSGIEVHKLTKLGVEHILSLRESHFLDVKAKEIAPAKLTKSLSAFANSEGGELYIGITKDMQWDGFESIEAANGHVQAFEEFFPLGTEATYEFLQSSLYVGLLLKVEIQKSKDVRKASDGKPYVRRGAQNLPVTTHEDLERLRLNKGIDSFETNTIKVPPEFITNSSVIIEFMLQVVPHSEPDSWLKKQMVLVDNMPTVAGVVLFSDEPQAILPKRCGIKLYRYLTSDLEGTRETLDFEPISIEGAAYQQIRAAVNQTVRILESIRIRTSTGLEKAKYPRVAIHEIIANAVLHRDYSIADDIHIKIFDNRVEVISPGVLPGHITPQNILQERFARNGTIVRLINKFPDPPNKDIGEGLNTAFNAMRETQLKDPEIDQDNSNVRVTLKHEPLATPEELILEYLDVHEQITNREGRRICYIGSENKMKRVLQGMVRRNLIEQVPNTTRYNAAYQLKKQNGAQKITGQPSLFESDVE